MNSAALEINEQRKTFNAITSVIPPGSSFGKSILLPKTHISTLIISRLSFILFHGDFFTGFARTVFGDSSSSLSNHQFDHLLSTYYIFTASNADFTSIMASKHKNIVFKTVGFRRFRKTANNDAIQGTY
jgi:hypothetical protein